MSALLRTARRVLVASATTTLAVALSAGPALAATGRIVTPTTDTTVSGVVAVHVEATRDGVFDSVDSVRVRLSLDGSQTAPGTQVANLSCVANCGSDKQTWEVLFDAGTFAPFGVPDAGACNGAYWLQPSINGGSFAAGVRVVRSQAPTAPGGVKVNPGIERATVTWTRAGAPDVTGYRVQRRAEGTSNWTTLATLAATATSHADEDVAAGDWEYRVATLRGDGRVNGSPAPACSDTGTDLQAPSAPVAASVRAPAPKPTASASPTPSPSETGTPGGEGPDGGSGGSTGGGTDPSEGPSGDPSASPSDGASDPDGSPEPTPSPTVTRRAAPRQAPPPAVGRTNVSGRVDLGDVEEPEVAEDRYYGEDDPFSEEFDFGDADPVIAEPGSRTVTEQRMVRVPGALQSVLGEELAIDRILGSVAAGLVLVTFSLHLRRWLREGATS